MSLELRFTNEVPYPLIRKVLWGTDGGLRYQVRDIRIAPGARIIEAIDNGAQLGAYVLHPMPWGWLRHMLMVDPDHQRQGIGTALSLFARDHLPGIKAGIIEADHAASLSISERCGYTHVATLDAYSFTRWTTRAHPSLEQTHLSHGTRYELGDASCIVDQHHWRIHDLGGFGGKLAAQLVLPLLGQSAEHYRFVSLHEIQGPPNQYESLWEAVLAAEQVNSGIATFDRKDPRLPEIQASVQWGAVGTVVGPYPWHVTSSASVPSPFSMPIQNS